MFTFSDVWEITAPAPESEAFTFMTNRRLVSRRVNTRARTKVLLSFWNVDSAREDEEKCTLDEVIAWDGNMTDIANKVSKPQKPLEFFSGCQCGRVQNCRTFLWVDANLSFRLRDRLAIVGT